MKTAPTKSELGELRELARSSSLRSEHGKVVVEGFRAISGAMQSGGVPSVILSVAKDLYRVEHESVVEVDQKTIDKIATTPSPQGAVGIFEMPVSSPGRIAAVSTPVFVLDNVADPGNLGTIIRSCVAFNIGGLVTFGGCDPYHPKVVRSSAGAIFGISIYCAFEHELQEVLEGRTLHAAFADAPVELSDMDVENNAAFVFGSEAHGINTPFFVNNAEKFSIRMAELCESLNVAMTATIVAHHCAQNVKK